MQFHPGGAGGARRLAVRVAALYLIFASLWIVASDRLLALVVHDAVRLAWVGTAKGMAFVAVSTLLLYLLLRVWGGEGSQDMPGKAAEPLNGGRVRGPLALFLGLALVVPLIGYGVVQLHGPLLREAAFADLAAVAELKAGQVESWLWERHGDADTLRDSEPLIHDVERWLQQGDGTARARSIMRLEGLKRAFHYDVALLDPSGRSLLPNNGRPDSLGPLRATLLPAALRSGQVQMSELYRDGTGRIRLDYVVPLVLHRAGADRPLAAAVLRAPAEQFLFPLIQTWPTASASAETLLVRRDGDSVLFLNELRHRRGTALSLRLPLASPDLPAAISLRGGRAGALEGRDYRGTAVLTAVRPVKGTAWLLVAKVDQAEVLAPLRQLVLWVGLVALAAVAAVAAVVLLLWRQQRRAYRLELLARSAGKDRLLKQFYELPFIGMGVTSPDFHWQHVNDRLCQILGRSRAELLGSTCWADLSAPEDLAADQALAQRVLAGVINGYEMEKRLPKQNGGYIDVCMAVKCVRDGAGRVEHFVKTVQDITARRQAEEVLHTRLDLQDQLSKIAASVPGAIYAFRQRADGSTCFPYASPAIEALYGFAPSDLAQDAAPAWAAIHPDDVGQVRASVAASVRALAPCRTEYRYRHPSRGEIWLEGHSMPAREADGGVIWHGYLHEVSERKRAEAALREADRRKDEFLAMLAHELRNPLAPIRNAAHILGRLGLAEPRLAWAQQVIERQVAYLGHLVDDLLDVSRIVRGKIVLDLSAFELADVVEQALEIAQPLIEAKGHHLAVHLPEQPVRIEGDPVRLAQVLLNLLDNAAKYTPDGGHIELDARQVGAEVEIAVRDDGMGIPVELLPRVFGLFQQGERGLDRAQGGLGIGLTVVQRLVQMHGGRVTADSAGPGRGATFSVRLPVLSASAPGTVSVPPPPERSGAGLRVLVVEDEPDVAQSLRMLLELEGHDVRIALAGNAALQLLGEFRPQVVLLDIGLPGLDGYQIAHSIRLRPEGESVLLVAVSGYGDAAARSRAQEAGFDHHLVKPVDPQVLFRLLAGLAGPAVALPAT